MTALERKIRIWQRYLHRMFAAEPVSATGKPKPRSTYKRRDMRAGK